MSLRLKASSSTLFSMSLRSISALPDPSLVGASPFVLSTEPASWVSRLPGSGVRRGQYPMPPPGKGKSGSRRPSQNALWARFAQSLSRRSSK
jgi:hypothetical protein